jgi:uncharacterized membrane protein
MQTSLPALLTIFAMASVTYLTRIGGVWLMNRISLPPRAKAWLTYLPGAVIVSLIAPTVLSTGFAETGAALATVLVAARTRNLLLAMIVGVGVVVGLRALLANIH